MNSYISNLYLKPTDGATSQRLSPTASTVASFSAFVRSTKGHKLYAGRAYTLSVEAARVAQFLSASGTAVIFASELTN